jgi:hypothetical protein
MAGLLNGVSVRTLLFVSIAIPLAGLSALAAQQIVYSYGQFADLKQAVLFQKFANVGGELAQRLPLPCAR